MRSYEFLSTSWCKLLFFLICKWGYFEASSNWIFSNEVLALETDISNWLNDLFIFGDSRKVSEFLLGVCLRL